MVDEAFPVKEITVHGPGGGKHKVKVRVPDLDFYKPKHNAFMPVEFAVTAYRFGHSMIRPIYRLNSVQKRVPIFSDDFSPDTRENLNGFRLLPLEFGFEWQFYSELGRDSAGHARAEGLPLTVLVNPLGLCRRRLPSIWACSRSATSCAACGWGCPRASQSPARRTSPDPGTPTCASGRTASRRRRSPISAPTSRTTRRSRKDVLREAKFSTRAISSGRWAGGLSPRRSWGSSARTSCRTRAWTRHAYRISRPAKRVGMRISSGSRWGADSGN